MTLKEMVRHPKFTLDEFEAWAKQKAAAETVSFYLALQKFCDEVVGETVGFSKYFAWEHGDDGPIVPLPVWAAAVQSLLWHSDEHDVPFSEVALIAADARRDNPRKAMEADLEQARDKVAALQMILAQDDDDAEDWVGHAR